jgi:hypothetical protein
MTALGKIFVFFNLVFSVVVFAFIIVVYTTRTNWQVAAKNLEKSAQVSKASLEASAQEMQQERDRNAKDIDALKAANKQLEGERDAEKKAHATTKQALAAAEKTGGGSGASLAALNADLKRREDEVKSLEKDLVDRENQIKVFAKAKNEEQQKRIQAEIDLNSYKAKAEQLETDLRVSQKAADKESAGRILQAVREVVRKMPNARAGELLVAVEGEFESRNIVRTGNAPPPPPRNVDGIITEVDAAGFVKISVGSDAGLVPGHTLDVYRLSGTGQYLGKIKLTSVRSNEAVGKVEGRPSAPIQKGDGVNTDISKKG